ncbi:MAG: tetratricopeptide repeat protein [Rhodospirillaceae bacterium]|nr:tetratricopeptide repeat protein [Rhodospirillaceae bacterium]
MNTTATSEAIKAKSKAAVALLQQGQVIEAERLLLELRAEDSTNVIAAYNLGTLAHARGDFEKSVMYFGEAARSRPDLADIVLAYAKALGDAHRLTEAVQVYDDFLKLNPKHERTLVDRSSALLMLGRFDEALSSVDRALAIDPKIIVAYFNRASALKELNRPDEALAALDQALALAPHFTALLQLKAVVLKTMGQPNEALGLFDAVLAREPNHIDALNNRGTTYYELGRYPEALVDLDRAIAVHPRSFEAHINRGRVLVKLNRLAEADASFDAALALDPRSPDALASKSDLYFRQNRYDDALRFAAKAYAANPRFFLAAKLHGDALLRLNRAAEAVDSYDKSLAINPNQIEAVVNKGIALRMARRFQEAAACFAQVLQFNPNHAYALGQLFDARRQACDWTEYDAIARKLSEGIRAGKRVETPFSGLNHITAPIEQLLCTQMYWGDGIAMREVPWTAPPYNNPKIRVAYLSADFHEHATAHLMAGMFEAHDRARFGTYAVSFGRDDNSSMRARLTKAFDHFVDVSTVSDPDLAAKLREWRIDIVVDLKGFTNNARPQVFTLRPAPVQVNFLGYPGTMGAVFYDYIIADATLIPSDQSAFYAEKVVTLPDTYQSNDRARPISNLIMSRTDLGLPAQGFVFCSFNGNYKITPQVFDVWMRLLKSVPGSVLWLLKGSDDTEPVLRREARARGVDPARLIFAPVAPPPDHRGRQKFADLFLDTLPICAHTTASDALWAGLPLVTCLGQTFVGRVAASLLKAAGVPELITTSMADYEALALKLATTPDLLAEIKAKIARNRDTCALFDTMRFTRHLETAYVTMHQRFLSGQRPVAFAVPPLS